MDELTPVKRALLEIRELKARLAAAEALRREPVAIVGMALRFPGGAVDAESFTRLLWSGTDAITEIPGDRWSLEALYSDDPDAPGKMTTRHGGFLEGVDRFDAPFFGISPREARSMDPQQRLVLEVGWEALENAGRAPDALAGSRTGVYLGIGNSDYGRALLSHPDLIDPYFTSGSALSVAAGRLSYVLGLQGPSLAVDTACSASLVALHLACQGLRLGECDMALAGGVSVILTPALNINFSKARMMAPDGRCKTFDASADGYVRGEGCGLLVLRRLRDAVADGDRILAVVRGSAINQDGRSGGLTAPNGPAQEAVIRDALDAAGVEAASIGYVEAHGTGTSLGDPIEMGALGAVLGAGRERTRPLPVGSVKTNIGHLETAAGVAGIIKVILALRRREIPPSLHFHTGNPHIDWPSLPVTVPTVVMPWAPIGGLRLAGVSSFGFSGTNAHVILEEAPEEQRTEVAAERPGLITLSAQTPAALTALTQRFADALAERPGLRLDDLMRTTTLGRAAFPYRTVVVADTTAAAQQQLAAAVGGGGAVGIVSGHAAPGVRPGIAFLFPGQGAQWAGMALELAAREPVVGKALAYCDEILRGELGLPLPELLGRGDLLLETRYTQPALFAVEWSLAQLWASWGVEPAAVLGHSVGEYVAATVAGVMSPEDALRLIALRGRLMQERTSRGAMAAVFADLTTVAEALEGQEERVSIAAVNAPDSIVVSGDAGAVASLRDALAVRGIECRPLSVSHAFHSPLMEPMLAEFADAAAAVRYRPAAIPLASNLTGAMAGEEIATPDYWVRHVRAPVRFSSGVEALAATGCAAFLEVGPGTALSGLAKRTLGEGSPHTVPTLRQGRGEESSVLEAVGRLWTSGVAIDWSRLQRDRGGRPVELPTYPFQRTRHWADEAIGPEARPVAPAEHRAEAGGRAERTRQWLYELEWRETARGPRSAGSERPATWLIIPDSNGVGEALGHRLEARGHRCLVAATEPELDRALGLSGDQRVTRVIHLPALDAPDADGLTAESLRHDAARSSGSLLALLHAVSRAEGTPPQLTVVVRGGQGSGLTAGPLAGLTRVAGFEHPDLGIRLLEVDRTGVNLDELLEELLVPDREPHVALYGGTRRVPRMVRTGRAETAGATPVDSEGTYLVTGGLGGLGLRVAASLVEAGARHLVLLGRRGPTDEALRTLERLETGGVRLRVAAVDVCDKGALAALFAEVGRTMPPLRGVIHAAGVLDDGLLQQMSWERFARVLAPKLEGAWNLHELTAGLPLQFFVLFSSAATLLGSPGQGNYAAANAFLDALSHHRRARGLPSLSINWGAWGEIGMAAARESTEQLRSARKGVESMAPDDALAVMHELLRGAPAQVAVMRLDWELMGEQYAPGTAPPLLEDLLCGPGGQSVASGPASVRQRLTAAPVEDRRQLIVSHVRETVAAVLGAAPAQIETGVPLVQLGLDSLMAVELKTRLDRDTGGSTALVHFLNGSDIERLSDQILTSCEWTQPFIPGAEERALLGQLDQMTDVEVDALLARMLKGSPAP